MPDLNDFYAFKMTTSDNGSVGSKNYKSNDGNGGGTECSTVLIVLTVIGWVLWFIRKFLAQYVEAHMLIVI